MDGIAPIASQVVPKAGIGAEKRSAAARLFSNRAAGALRGVALFWTGARQSQNSGGESIFP